MDWHTVELKGYQYYSEKGYTILVPLVLTRAYDFVAEKDGKFIRVNVKKAGLRDLDYDNSWSIAQGTLSDKSEYVDIFLAYIPAQNKFIELPGTFFSDVGSKSKRIPKVLF